MGGLQVHRAAARARIADRARNYLGTLRRIIQGRRRLSPAIALARPRKPNREAPLMLTFIFHQRAVGRVRAGALAAACAAAGSAPAAQAGGATRYPDRYIGDGPHRSNIARSDASRAAQRGLTQADQRLTSGAELGRGPPARPQHLGSFAVHRLPFLSPETAGSIVNGSRS